MTLSFNVVHTPRFLLHYTFPKKIFYLIYDGEFSTISLLFTRVEIESTPGVEIVVMCCHTVVSSLHMHFLFDSEMLSSPRSTKQNTFIIRRDPILFLETRKYHSRAMKRLFLKYYEPLSTNGKRNKHWTLNVSPSDMIDLKVHLSWIIGKKVFTWSSEGIGREILRFYKKSGELRFLKNLAIQTQSNLTHFGKPCPVNSVVDYN